MYNQSDWEKAHILGNRAFYEHGTETLRACPENYCLAYKSQTSGKWLAYRDEGATRAIHNQIQDSLDIWQHGSTAEALAKELGKLLPERSNA